MSRYIRLPLFAENGMETGEYIRYNYADFMTAVPNGTLHGSGKPEIIEWRPIPGFTGYLIDPDGMVYLGDEGECNPTQVYPLSRHSLVDPRYNLLHDDGRGREINASYLLGIAFPERTKRDD